jgi:hypothetical protein
MNMHDNPDKNLVGSTMSVIYVYKYIAFTPIIVKLLEFFLYELKSKLTNFIGPKAQTSLIILTFGNPIWRLPFA